MPPLWAQGVEAQPIVTSSARWQSSLDAFAAADRVSTPAQGGVVFVGSSSIRLWRDLEASFENHPTVVKRGFGGS
ncbi:MAG TPA: GDSL family lipase, partial [Hydrogenophaga sp.]|nr:GDSL family lipase [Hydrogenophaga sp.]